MPPRTPPEPSPLKCGFQTPNGDLVSTPSLREAVRQSARIERKRWWFSSSVPGLGLDIEVCLKEALPWRFGDLVRYWLAHGRESTIRPSLLRAAQKAACDSSIPILRGDNAAIEKFRNAERAVEAQIEEVYAAYDALDLQNARSSSKLLDSDRSLEALRLYRVAKTRRDESKIAAKELDPKNLEAVRAAILQKIGADASRPLGDMLKDALQLAHRSRIDMEAWSAVFIVSCIRSAAIDCGLEAIDKRNIHRGRDGLLFATRRHWEYVVVARERQRRAVNGTYHAYEPHLRSVNVGDIVCTDRQPFITKHNLISLRSIGPSKPENDIIQQLKSIEPRKSGGRECHGDLVSEISMSADGKGYAETIGGNVGQTVRRRRYQLDEKGRLVVSEDRLYAQESDYGQFESFETLTRIPSRLKGTSTGRIFALLSLAEECRLTAEDSSIARESSPTVGAVFMNYVRERTGSPFTGPDILRTESAQEEFPFRISNLDIRSPFQNALQQGRFEPVKEDDEHHRFVADEDLLASDERAGAENSYEDDIALATQSERSADVDDDEDESAEGVAQGGHEEGLESVENAPNPEPPTFQAAHEASTRRPIAWIDGEDGVHDIQHSTESEAEWLPPPLNLSEQLTSIFRALQSFKDRGIGILRHLSELYSEGNRDPKQLVDRLFHDIVYRAHEGSRAKDRTPSEQSQWNALYEFVVGPFLLIHGRALKSLNDDLLLPGYGGAPIVLGKNEFKLVKFPETGIGFARYSGTSQLHDEYIHPVTKVLGRHGDSWITPQAGADFYNSIQDFRLKIEGQDVIVHYGDISAYDPSINLGHQAHSQGKGVDIHYIGSNGEEIIGESAYLNADVARMNAFFSTAQAHRFTRNYSYGRRFAHRGSWNHGSHRNHFHIGQP
jgi:Uncharacterized protein conserved in bacteria (DUF2272)